MKRSLTIITLLLVCLLTLGSVGFRQVEAQSQNSTPNVTIYSDGTFTPTNAPIQHSDSTYIFQNNWSATVTVEKSNVVMNGNGYTISSLQVDGAQNVTIEEFKISGGQQFGADYYGFVAGISLSSASNTVIANNTIEGVWNFFAIFGEYERVNALSVVGGRLNIIEGNRLVNNWQGMYISGSNNNTIVGNTITSNASPQTGYSSYGGIDFESSSNNTIYHNNFEVNVGGIATDSYYGSINVWDNGFPFGGNYWSDYKAKYLNAVEIGTSSIGNESYVIDGPDGNSSSIYNVDRYPLMEPFSDSFYAKQKTPPTISILSPVSQTYNSSSVTLEFSITVLSPAKTVSWVCYSFDGKSATNLPSAPLTNITLSNMTAGSHSVTVYANDTYGNIAVPQTINFTVAKPPDTAQHFATIAVVAVAIVIIILAVEVFLYRKKQKGNLSQY
jgi:parallel beta-helix repeat protein